MNKELKENITWICMLIGTIIGILVGSIFNLDVSVTTAFGMIVGYLFGLMMFMY